MRDKLGKHNLLPSLYVKRGSREHTLLRVCNCSLSVLFLMTRKCAKVRNDEQMFISCAKASKKDGE